MAIEFQGLNQEFTTQTPSTGTAVAVPSPLERSALLSRVAWRFENAERRGRYERLGNLVVETLDNRVDALQQAASRFSWPVSGDSQRKARLVTPASANASTADVGGASPTAKELLRAELSAPEDAQRYYKFFSRGRSPYGDSGIAAGDYSFSVTQGDASETVDVSIDADMNWGQALSAVADAVNATSLPVQAEVIRQTAPNQRLEFLSREGSILGVTVSAGHQDQDVSFRDLDGVLTTKLDLDPTETPVAAATVRTHNVASASPASATTYTTVPVNPAGDPGLAAGEHRLLYAVGDVTGTVAVTVDDDMDWEELLQALSNRINATDTELSARVTETTMPTGGLDPQYQRAMQLEVTLDSPKRGDRLALSDYGAGWLDDVDGFIDPSGGLPNWVTGGERYIASATANGWTEGNLYEYDGSAWSETTPEAENAVTNDDDGLDWFYDGSNWSTTASGSLGATLGLNLTAVPGADAAAHIDGRDMTSETSLFTLDQGRMTVEVAAPVGQNLPLRVEEGYAAVQDRMTDLVGAYNDLQSYLTDNADLFEAGFDQTWSDPVADLSAELEWMGVEPTGDAETLWVQSDAFAQALVQDPERMRAALVDAPDGLAPRLEAISAANSGSSLADRLVHPNVLAEPEPSPAVEAELAEDATLAEVVSARTDAPRPEQSPYTDFTNIMADIVRRGREQMALLDNLADSARIFDSES